VFLIQKQKSSAISFEQQQQQSKKKGREMTENGKQLFNHISPSSSSSASSAACCCCCLKGKKEKFINAKLFPSKQRNETKFCVNIQLNFGKVNLQCRLIEIFLSFKCE